MLGISFVICPIFLARMAARNQKIGSHLAKSAVEIMTALEDEKSRKEGFHEPRVNSLHNVM